MKDKDYNIDDIVRGQRGSQHKRYKYGQNDKKYSTWEEYKFILFIVGVPVLIGVGIVFGTMFFVDNFIFTETTNERFEKTQIEEKAIKQVIADGKLTCEYIGELRLKYAGDGFINALDDSYIKGKVMTFWNVKSCGDEWNWYD
jgi:hypothetical protein